MNLRYKPKQGWPAAFFQIQSTNLSYSTFFGCNFGYSWCGNNVMDAIVRQWWSMVKNNRSERGRTKTETTKHTHLYDENKTDERVNSCNWIIANNLQAKRKKSADCIVLVTFNNKLCAGDCNHLEPLPVLQCDNDIDYKQKNWK